MTSVGRPRNTFGLSEEALARIQDEKAQLRERIAELDTQTAEYNAARPAFGAAVNRTSQIDTRITGRPNLREVDEVYTSPIKTREEAVSKYMALVRDYPHPDDEQYDTPVQVPVAASSSASEPSADADPNVVDEDADGATQGGVQPYGNVTTAESVGTVPSPLAGPPTVTEGDPEGITATSVDAGGEPPSVEGDDEHPANQEGATESTSEASTATASEEEHQAE